MTKSDQKPQFQYRKTAELIPSAQNSRTHSDAQIEKIKASIKQFGFLSPVIVAKDGVVIAGHGRLVAAKALGIEEVPTILADHLTDAQRRAYMIADNRLAEDAGWNEEILARELKDLFLQEFDLELTGFDDDELAKLLNPHISMTDEDDIPDPPAARAKLGETWLLGDHRLRCGDSTNDDDIKALMGNDTSELLFTSPPYSDIRTYGGGKDLSVDNLNQFISKFFPYAKYQAINLGLKREKHEIVQYWDRYIAAARTAGYLFLSWNVWAKTGAGSVGNQSAFIPISHEWILVFGKKFKDINRAEERKTDPKTVAPDRMVRQQDGSMKPSSRGQQLEQKEMESVFHSAPELGEIRQHHPATFPVELPRKYINAMTDEGQIVIEPFAGSGSTILACHTTYRKCYAMELDPLYCDVAIARWQNFTGQKAKRESDGILFDDLKPETKVAA